MTWSPFDDKLLATSTEKGIVKFWKFDDYEGVGEPRSECNLEIDAHEGKKCFSVQWHAAADSLIATNSIDKTIKIWDIENCDEPCFTFTDMPDHCTSIRWSPDGKMLAGMVKNKTMVICDPR